MAEMGTDGDGGAGAEARRRNAGGETASARKPFERVADASAVNTSRPNAAQRCRKIQKCQRISHGIDQPRKP